MLERICILKGFFFTVNISRVFAGTNELSAIASYKCLVSKGVAQKSAKEKINEGKNSAVLFFAPFFCAALQLTKCIEQASS